MTNVLPFIFIGLIYSIIIFFIVETISLRRAKEPIQENCDIYDVNRVYVCLEKYQTIKYALIYIILVTIYTVTIAIIDFIPHNLGLAEIVSYVLSCALLGSLYILIFKWRKELIIKVFSSLMYGSLFIFGSILGFAFSYIFFK